MNRIRLLIVLLVLPLLAMRLGEEGRIKLRSDRVLVVPGIGAEGVELGEDVAVLVSLVGYPEKIVNPGEKKEIIRDIFNARTSLSLYYDKVYYYQTRKSIFFINQGRVSAIAGLERSRVTIDSVDLDAGLENFIFNYGNEGLQVLERQKGRLYIYKKIGILVADDLGDNSIDLFIVFPPLS